MNKAPKKIWVDVTPYEFYQTWSAEKSEMIDTDIQYIRADLVDELVEALEDMVNIAECSGNIVRNARTALAKIKEET